MAQAPAKGAVVVKAPAPAGSDFTFEVAPPEEQPDYTFEVASPEEQPDAQPAAPKDDGIPTWYKMLHSGAEKAASVTIGALKSATEGFVGLGDMVHKVPGVDAAVDALYGTPGLSRAASADMHRLVQPQGAAEKAGYYVEQIGELMAPGPKGSGMPRASNLVAKGTAAVARVSPTAARLGPQMVAEGARSAAQADMHGGDPKTAAVLGAGAPVLGAAATRYAKPVATRLVETAEKRVNQALGPTKERFKSMADKIVPEILRRGLGAGKSREALLEEATDAAKEVSKQLDSALQKVGTKQASGVQDVMDTLENSKNAFRRPRVVSVRQALQEGLLDPAQIVTTGQGGTRIALKQNQRLLPNGMLEHMVEFDKRPIEQLEALRNVVKELGPAPTIDHLVALRRTWDGIVDGAGGYSHHSPGGIGTPLPEQAEAWGKMKGANAIRKLLAAEVPDLAAINKEYHFWRSLRDVLAQTVQRKLPQENSLLAKIAQGTGAVAGAATGFHYGGPGGGAGAGVASAYAMGKLSEMFQRATTSPGWRMATAQMRSKLADAIMNNDVSAVATMLGRITAVQSSGTRPDIAAQGTK